MIKLTFRDSWNGFNPFLFQMSVISIRKKVQIGRQKCLKIAFISERQTLKKKYLAVSSKIQFRGVWNTGPPLFFLSENMPQKVICTWRWSERSFWVRDRPLVGASISRHFFLLLLLLSWFLLIFICNFCYFLILNVFIMIFIGKFMITMGSSTPITGTWNEITRYRNCYLSLHFPHFYDQNTNT